VREAIKISYYELVQHLEEVLFLGKTASKVSKKKGANKLPFLIL